MAAPTRGQHFVSTGTLTTSAVTTTGGPGSVFLVLVTDGFLSTTAPDNKGNNYTFLRHRIDAGGTQIHRVYACANGVGGASHTWTVVNGSGIVSQPTVIMHEWLGCAKTGAVAELSAFLDGTGAGSRATNPVTPKVDDVVIAFGSTDSANASCVWTWGSFTTGDTQASGATTWAAISAYKTIASAGATSETFTFSDTASTTYTMLVRLAWREQRMPPAGPSTRRVELADEFGPYEMTDAGGWF